LLNEQTKEFCNIPTDMSICEKCLDKKFDFENFSLIDWRKKISKFINNCDMVVYPSLAAQEIFRKVFNPSKEMVIPHGIDEETILKGAKLRHEKDKEYKDFSIAFVGYMEPKKGSELVKKAVPLLLKNNIEVHFIGPVPEDFIKIKSKSETRLFYHGYYKSTVELIEKLKYNGIKLVCLLSPWPETFSYVLSEIWSAGIPVVVTPLGAPAQRMSKLKGGIVLKDLNVHLTMCNLGK